jgi:hypothetical protein
MNTCLKLFAGAAALLAAGQGMAVGPGTTPDYTFYLGGGSEQAPAVRQFAETLLGANADVYTDQSCDSGLQGSNYTAVYGVGQVVDGDASFAGKNVLIVYAGNGGGFPNGIAALVNATAISYPNFLGANSSACLGAAYPNPTYAYTGTATVNAVPVLGFADEEISLYTGVNLPFAYNNGKGSSGPAQTPPSKAALNNVTAVPLYDLVYGVAIDSLLAAQKRNFSTAELTAILAGSYSDWNQLTGDQGGYAGAALPGGAITIIDRAAGSGVKAAFNSYFLHNPGAALAGGAIPPANASGGYGDCGAPTADSYATPMPGANLPGTVQGYDESNGGDCSQSSDGNVQIGLDNANTDGARAIGILSLSYPPGSADTYQFATLNGAAAMGSIDVFTPALVQSGAYDLFYTALLLYRKASVGGAPYEGDGSAYSQFITDFAYLARQPVNQLATPGIMLDPIIGGSPFTQPYGQCIAKGTHNQNSTSPLQLVY